MKYLRLLLIFFVILLLNSCGYKNLNSQKINDFKINKIETNGKEKLGYKLKNNIEIYSSQNSKLVYNIKINLKSTKETKIKNNSGKSTRYSNILQADVLIINTNTLNEYKKTFTSSTDYDVGLTHSDTLNNEKNTTENNINYISNEIVKYLRLLNI